MLNIFTLTLGSQNTNCYIVFDSENRKGVVIDPADEGDYICQKVSQEKVNLTAILATHGHFDHILAATYLKLIYKIPFFMCKEDEFLLSRMAVSARRFTNMGRELPPQIDRDLSGGSKINVGKYILKVIKTPGHTPGSVSFFVENRKTIFVGDLLFSNGDIGRYDFKYSDKIQLKDSLKKIFNFSGKTQIYSGHGNSANLITCKRNLQSTRFM